MLIVCPNCSTSYEIAAHALGEGRTVRCARCKNRWFATAVELIPAGAELETATAGPSAEDLAAQEAAATKAMEDEWSAALAAEPVAHSKFEVDEKPLPPAFTAVPASEAPPLAPSEPPAAEREPEPHEDIETIAARRAQIAAARKKRRKTSFLNLPVAIAAMAAVLVLLLAGRERVVRFVPQTAGLYAKLGMPVNLRGLIFDNVRTSEEMHEAVPVLVAEGAIVNVSQRIVDVPRLRFAVRNAGGLEIYAWTAQPPSPVMKPGERMSFRSRLASPPADSKDVVVRFFSRRDLEAGR
jgi:predicted Zn finger-like uncharacterized protein